MSPVLNAVLTAKEFAPKRRGSKTARDLFKKKKKDLRSDSDLIIVPFIRNC